MSKDEPKRRFKKLDCVQFLLPKLLFFKKCNTNIHILNDGK